MEITKVQVDNFVKYVKFYFEEAAKGQSFEEFMFVEAIEGIKNCRDFEATHLNAAEVMEFVKELEDVKNVLNALK